MRPPPPRLVSDAPRRRADCFASYRLVKWLIDRGGLSVFMKLYEADNPEVELPKL